MGIYVVGRPDVRGVATGYRRVNVYKVSPLKKLGGNEKTIRINSNISILQRSQQPHLKNIKQIHEHQLVCDLGSRKCRLSNA